MKYATLTAFAVFAAHVSYGQKTEYSVHLNSGGFGYRGSSSSTGSGYAISDTGMIPFYANSPYSSRLGVSYGLAGQIQRVTPTNDVFGVQVGYEVLRNRRAITEIGGIGFFAPASGYIKLDNQLANVYPFFGRRFTLGGVVLDLAGGPEVGLLFRSHVEEDITSGTTLTFNSEYNRNRPRLDARARIHLTTYYKHVGLTVGYSRGLTNYYGNTESSTNEAYSQVLRLGLAYRI